MTVSILTTKIYYSDGNTIATNENINTGKME